MQRSFSDVIPTNPNSPEPLPDYALQAYLPPLIIQHPAGPVKQYAPRWDLENLNCAAEHSRATRKVTVVDPTAAENAARAFIESFGDDFRAHRQNRALTMPCSGFRTLGPEALEKLVVDSERAFLHTLRYFVLDTAAELIRTVERRQFDEDVLGFIRYAITNPDNGESMWHMFTFDKFAQPTGTVRPGIAVFAIPPWELGEGDIEIFTMDRDMEQGTFDRETHRNWFNGFKLWALVYDTCKRSGFRWFVVTNYSQWIFGTWSLDWTAADVLPAMPFDRTHDMSILTMVMFWTMNAWKDSNKWLIPRDTWQPEPTPSVRSSRR